MKRQKSKSLIYILSALFLLIIAIYGGRGNSSAFADTAESYSPVLSDLEKDETFNASDYPEKADDYSLDVIQLAESKKGELFVYVYQPCKYKEPLTATLIHISKTDKAADTVVYSLSLLNSNGVFYKYRVDGFELADTQIRIYNVTSILRKYCEEIDVSAGNAPDNHTTNVAFTVGKTWYAQTVDGKTVYKMEEFKTVDVTSKYVSFIRYEAWEAPSWVNSMLWHMGSRDFVEAWYVAFDTDIPITQLLEATVYFSTVNTIKDTNGANIPSGSGGFTYEEDKRYTTDVLKYDDKSKVELPNDIWGNTYSHSWSLIQSVEDFKTSEGLEDVEALSDKKWVLRFYQYFFDFNDDGRLPFPVLGRIVDGFTILRLKFLSEGRVYDIGCVDNYQGADVDKEPDKTYRPSNGGCAGLDSSYMWIVWVVLGVIAIGILVSVLSLIFPIFKGVWWVISAPFRGIAALFKRPRKRRK